jgi:hypothetical protein
MDSTTEVPVVRARLGLHGNGRVWRLVEPCPFCGGPHRHWAGPGNADPDASLGERLSPCKAGRYRVVADRSTDGSRAAKWSRIAR